jgi:uncharacterized alpha-E superfamily protein
MIFPRLAHKHAKRRACETEQRECECVCAALGALGQRKNKQKQSRRRDSFSYLLLSEKASGSIPGCARGAKRESSARREQVSQ